MEVKPLKTHRVSTLLLSIFLILPLFLTCFKIPEISTAIVFSASESSFSSSDPIKWPVGTCKAVDTTTPTDESGEVYRDILAVYYYEATNDLYFRVDFIKLEGPSHKHLYFSSSLNKDKL